MVLPTPQIELAKRFDYSSSIQSLSSSSPGGEKAKDLAHHAVPLIGLEQILSVRRAIQNDQLLRSGSFLVLFMNPGQAWPICMPTIPDFRKRSSGRLQIAFRVARLNSSRRCTAVENMGQFVDGSRRGMSKAVVVQDRQGVPIPAGPDRLAKIVRQYP
jgi:hypothetical protein